MRAATWSALALSLTLSRSEVDRHQRVVAAITSVVATGARGRKATRYLLAGRAEAPGMACVNDGAQRFPDAARGARVRAVLDPMEGKGHMAGWCPGRYRGTVTYFTGFACPAKGRCHTPKRFRADTQIVARFSFRVR